MSWRLKKQLFKVVIFSAMMGLSLVFFTHENVHANETNALEPVLSAFQDREGLYLEGIGGDLYVGYDPLYGVMQAGIQLRNKQA